MATEDLIREVREKLSAATQPELWTACPDEDGVWLVCLRKGDVHAGPVVWRDAGQSLALTKEDAALIGATPRLLGQLLTALEETQRELSEQRARAVVAEQHKTLSLMGRSSYRELVEDNLRTKLAETELRAEAAERRVSEMEQQIENKRLSE